MIRTVMIKGIEALTLECFLAAERAGLVEEVAVSMQNNYPTLDFGRSPTTHRAHGEPRRAPCRGDGRSCVTLRELGLDPAITEGTVKRQREMGPSARSEGPGDLE